MHGQEEEEANDEEKEVVKEGSPLIVWYDSKGAFCIRFMAL